MTPSFSSFRFWPLLFICQAKAPEYSLNHFLCFVCDLFPSRVFNTYQVRVHSLKPVAVKSGNIRTPAATDDHRVFPKSALLRN